MARYYVYGNNFLSWTTLKLQKPIIQLIKEFDSLLTFLPVVINELLCLNIIRTLKLYCSLNNLLMIVYFEIEIYILTTDKYK